MVDQSWEAASEGLGGVSCKCAGTKQMCVTLKLVLLDCLLPTMMLDNNDAIEMQDFYDLSVGLFSNKTENPSPLSPTLPLREWDVA